MRIGHFQLISKLGDFDGNLAKVVESLKRADRDRVEVVSFPECYLTGYTDSAEKARQGAFSLDSPQMMKVLEKTMQAEATFIVGFNESRGKDLYNTSAIIHKGHVLGTYSKCSAYMPFHKQGREFPVFERAGVKFGVIICSDGGYIEPARLLAIKGAKIIFAPHYNAIGATGLINHFMNVRNDHTARAVENRVFFVRGNNVAPGIDPSFARESVAYGDSYILDPNGEMVVRTRRHQEDFIFADIDPAMAQDTNWGVGRSLWSAREFGKLLAEAIEKPK
ncbi:carbon-nitrogen hydrolase family protein [Zavarzinella formosa]|uniref:carbon-nitrogen hydrolase family protein n=1 Tax=Zavarzinella formosa TaxID=360055 RepID=UPI0003130BB6|nr:carbon-nitrogen hydrolase family protein [Zavarzinella formosa]